MWTGSDDIPAVVDDSVRATQRCDDSGTVYGVLVMTEHVLEGDLFRTQRGGRWGCSPSGSGTSSCYTSGHRASGSVAYCRHCHGCGGTLSSVSGSQIGVHTNGVHKFTAKTRDKSLNVRLLINVEAYHYSSDLGAVN